MFTRLDHRLTTTTTTPHPLPVETSSIPVHTLFQYTSFLFLLQMYSCSHSISVHTISVSTPDVLLYTLYFSTHLFCFYSRCTPVHTLFQYLFCFYSRCAHYRKLPTKLYNTASWANCQRIPICALG